MTSEVAPNPLKNIVAALHALQEKCEGEKLAPDLAARIERVLEAVLNRVTSLQQTLLEGSGKSEKSGGSGLGVVSALRVEAKGDVKAKSEASDTAPKVHDIFTEKTREIHDKITEHPFLRHLFDQRQALNLDCLAQYLTDKFYMLSCIETSLDNILTIAMTIFILSASIMGLEISYSLRSSI